MEVRVVCLGGPSIYAGKIFDDIDPGNSGYFHFQGSVVTGPSAWYRIDYDADVIQTEYGPAQPANYVGDSLPADPGQS